MTQILEPTRVAAPSHSPPDVCPACGRTAGQALGWFSIGLGLAEVLAPQAMARLTGVQDEKLLQVYGMREIACGVGILNSDRPAGWLWARVAGDLCDLSTLRNAMNDDEGRGSAEAAFVAVAGVTILDVVTAMTLSTSANSQR